MELVPPLFTNNLSIPTKQDMKLESNVQLEMLVSLFNSCLRITTATSEVATVYSLSHVPFPPTKIVISKNKSGPAWRANPLHYPAPSPACYVITSTSDRKVVTAIKATLAWLGKTKAKVSRCPPFPRRKMAQARASRQLAPFPSSRGSRAEFV